MKRITNIILYLFLVACILLSSTAKIEGVKIADALLLMLLITYFVRFIITNNLEDIVKKAKYLIKEKYYILIFFVIAYMFFSVFYSLEKGLALSESLRFLSYIVLLIFIAFDLPDYRVIEKIFYIAMVLITLICLFGIFQHFTGYMLQPEFITNYEFGAKNRITSTFENPNLFGAFLVLFFYPILMLAFGDKKKSLKIFSYIVCTLMLVNIIFTFSRNAWLGLGIGAVVFIITYEWKAIFALIIGLLISFKIPIIGNRLMDFFRADQNASRIKHWTVAKYMIGDHPLFGVGNGNYVSNYDSYIKKYPQLDYANLSRFPTHNSYIKIISELGILGGIPFIISLLWTVLRFKQNLKLVEEPFIKSLFKGFEISFYSFMIMNIFDNLFFVTRTAIWFWFVFALSEGIRYNVNREQKFKHA